MSEEFKTTSFRLKQYLHDAAIAKKVDSRGIGAYLNDLIERDLNNSVSVKDEEKNANYNLKIDKLEDMITEVKEVIAQKLHACEENMEEFRQKTAEFSAEIGDLFVVAEKSLKSSSKRWNQLAESFDETAKSFAAINSHCQSLPNIEHKYLSEIEEFKKRLLSESDGYRKKLDRFVIKHYMVSVLFLAAIVVALFIGQTLLPNLLK